MNKCSQKLYIIKKKKGYVLVEQPDIKKRKDIKYFLK